MKPKILVALENHADTAANKPYAALAKHLHKKYGFTQWTVESPAASTQAQLIAQSKEVVDSFNMLAQEVLRSKCSKQAFGASQPKSLDDIAIAELLPLFDSVTCIMSAKGQNLDARMLAGLVSELKKLPGRKLELENLRRIGAFMKIRGMDRNDVGSADGSYQSQMLRNPTLVGNIIKFYKAGISQMVTIGKNHLPGLILGLHAEGLLDRAVFLDLHSTQFSFSSNPMTRFNRLLTGYNTVLDQNRIFPQLSSEFGNIFLQNFKPEMKKIEALAQKEQLPLNIVSFNVDGANAEYTELLNLVDQMFAIHLSENSPQGFCKPTAIFSKPVFTYPTITSDRVKPTKPMLFSSHAVANDASDSANDIGMEKYMTGAFMLFMCALAYKLYKRKYATPAVVNAASQSVKQDTTSQQGQQTKHKKKHR